MLRFEINCLTGWSGAPTTWKPQFPRKDGPATDMRCVFVAQGNVPESYPWTLKVAQKFTGCEVIDISESPHGVGTHVPLHTVSDGLRELLHETQRCTPRRQLRNLCMLSILRWFAIREYLDKSFYDGWVFCPDWDVLLFTDLREFVNLFPNVDGLWCPGSAAQAICSGKMLQGFCDTLLGLTRASAPYLCDETYSDMNAWFEFIQFSKYRMGAMNKPMNGLYYDGQLYHDTAISPDGLSMVTYFEKETANEYRTVGEDGHEYYPKRIVWRDDLPHYVRLGTGELIRAACIHCWGGYKQRIIELARTAGCT